MQEIKLTYSDYCKFSFYMEFRIIMNWIKYLFFPMMIFIAFLIVIHNKQGKIHPYDLILPICIVIIPGIMWIIKILYYSHLTHYKAKKINEDHYQMQYNQDGVYIETETIKSTILWLKFNKIIETKSMLMLWYNNGSVFMIPKQQLSNWIELKNIIRSNFKGTLKLKTA
ncbi:YcxB family protein [candidate division CSSED10-310 bacterium]|uniref:YcxB family protein n=1 Tax=candidate division CSSED10-310 bacterium TaxID=2855610 RepID=A0ABV6YVY5_UNCC1